jgi:hypothetical protein
VQVFCEVRTSPFYTRPDTLLKIIASKRDSVQPSAEQQQTGQSIPAPSVSNEPDDNMVRVVTVVRQIMRELKGSASEKAKIMVITNIVYNLLQEDDK